MDHEWSELVARIVQAGAVSEGDILELRDAVWAEEAITQPQVDGIFMINDRCGPTSQKWIEFFIEAVEHYLLQQKQPFGFMDEAGAAWLHARIDREGRVASAVEMELLVAILEAAENAPETLKNYALSEVERTILSGKGATRFGPIRPNCVDDIEVQLLRRLIFAGGGEGAIVVGSQEADMLFRIKDATLGQLNAPSWLPLFVQAIGNHLLAHSDYRPLTIDEAERLNAEMNRNTPSIAGFIGRMIPRDRFGRGTIVEAFQSIFPKQETRAQALLRAEPVSCLSTEEAGWLKTHIAADGQVDDYEKALLTFVIEEVGNLPSALESLRLRA